MSYTRIILISVVVGICACDLLRGSGAGVLADPDEPEAPQDQFDELVAAALDRAVVSEKDIPDYQLLSDKSTVVVLNVTDRGIVITRAALPHSEEVGFVLASPDEIQEIADRDGDFLHLQVGEVDIDDDSGVVSLSTRWARAKQSDVVYLSGGGYELLYRWEGDEWSFEKLVRMWIS